MEYLNEKRLGDFLKVLYPDKEFIHDKIVPDSKSRRRPDYRCDELKLIVEFDGERHYTEAEKLLNEEGKTELYQSMGYKVVRIPYFIQMSEYTVKVLFGLDVKIDEHYPHGFIDSKCFLPCDFCELGIEKYKRDLQNFPEINKDITDSLLNKIEEKGDHRRVLPTSYYKEFKNHSH